MPVLNPHPVYFPAAVASVLGQSFGDFELLIVEDPAPRSAAELLAGLTDPRVRHVRNARRTGLVDQLNQGLELARGGLIARFDADDLCHPDRLRQQVEWLDRHPEVAVLGSQLAVIDHDGRTVGYRSYPLTHEEIVAALPRYNALAHPSTLYRREVVLSAGGYQYRKYPANEDYELWCRLASRGIRLANHPETLLRYRIHPEGMKAEKLRGIIRGTLEVKAMYWRRAGWPAAFRRWGERALLGLPPGLVLRLFMALTYRRRPLGGAAHAS
jgi:glycosyltransferase involved in cell wall biosynthesis